jgi:nitrogen regulatory protein PII
MTKRNIIAAVGVCALLVMAVTGCGVKKATTAKEAIKIAEAMVTKEKQEEYLERQARLFFEDKDFQQTIDIARYVLTYISEGSEVSKKLITKSQNAMDVQAAGGTGPVKKAVPGVKQ